MSADRTTWTDAKDKLLEKTMREVNETFGTVPIGDRFGIVAGRIQDGRDFKPSALAVKTRLGDLVKRSAAKAAEAPATNGASNGANGHAAPLFDLGPLIVALHEAGTQTDRRLADIQERVGDLGDVSETKTMLELLSEQLGASNMLAKKEEELLVGISNTGMQLLAELKKATTILDRLMKELES